ncbi:hypothetical protein FRZ03_08185 [Streptomyces misionensis]|uniref:Uncharacterized protein n=1 Tax=Streptomyces misionensis TaxID=67331 RepID=A0A5C6JYY8_9ACTN|nr:DUF6027 family protein [Streptomyces misionensis]TWV53934.1 hypothetical protein FRZ03_08185 [Streptomyces misionensis]
MTTVPHEETGQEEEPTIRLHRWCATWPDNDPHANFKSDVVLYGRLDPLATLRGMSESLGIPVGALARYVLARWATGGSGGLLEIGPVMVHRLWEPIAEAERQDSDGERLRAYHRLREMIAWLKLPLDEPSVYPAQYEDTTDTADTTDTKG